MSEVQIERASHGEKAETVSAVQERLRSAKMAIVTEYRGLSVAQMTRLRRDVRGASGEYQVIKNTLVRRALEGTVTDAEQARATSQIARCNQRACDSTRALNAGTGLQGGPIDRIAAQNKS